MPRSPKRRLDEQEQALPKFDKLVKSEKFKTAEEFARRIALALAGGRYDLAKRVLNIAVYEIDSEPDTLPNRTLADIGVDLRTANMLEKHFDVVVVRDLAKVRTAEVLGIGNVGPRTIDHIWQAVLAALIGKSEDSDG